MFRRVGAGSLLILVATGAHVTGQQPAPLPVPQQSATPPSVVVTPDDATAIASAWTLLAQGKYIEASAIAEKLAGQNPRSPVVLLIAIEAAIGRGGAMSALDTYERWLATRTLDEPGALRRIGRAVLAEQARQSTDPIARTEALKALVRDGDAEAGQALLSGASTGRLADLRTLASLGNPDAIDRIVARIKAMPPGPKVTEIVTLGDSGSQRAVTPLIELLADPTPHNRGLAAEALGRLGSPTAIAPLQALLQDPRTRFSAAGALYRLGDTSGEALLKGPEGAQSEHAASRRSAAFLLASRPDDAWKTLVRGLLVHPDPTFRLDAAKMLLPHEPETMRLILDSLATDANPEIRDEASLALVEIPTTSMLSLRSLLRTGSPRVRVGAAARLLTLTR